MNVSCGDTQYHVQIVSSGGNKALHVVQYLVSHIAGTHATIAIMDVANEKCRLKLAQGGGKQIGQRKNIGDNSRSGLKLRKGKENRPMTRVVLADWIPPRFGTSGACTSTLIGSQNPQVVQSGLEDRDNAIAP
ncbi:hypothetical protein V6N11_082831 [Hibiscus sabdariffa]|uniref:Uncharacterized protein n=1 Tax=Hibiscus sabdariffa TaxID=183260 RepID=A0ABR2QK86_9ROSI